MNKQSSEWTNGIALTLEDKDQTFIKGILKELGAENDYSIDKKSVGLIKAGFADKELDSSLIKFESQILPLLKELLPINLVSKKVRVIKPWNALLNEIIWFGLEPPNEKISSKITGIRSELQNILSPVINNINKERNVSYKPHLTLIYEITNELKNKIHKQLSPGINFEDRLTTYLKTNNYLPHTFQFEHAVFYLTNDERKLIL